ncbi:MAG: hypothetical protein E3J72_15115 [Planctomycetota bacterium]|nr:MAG: hypothetical protein E3J72_15115 [Planctomycetota bacterium]
MNPPSSRTGADTTPLSSGEYSLLGWALLGALIIRIYIAATTCVIAVDGIEYIRAADIMRSDGLRAASKHFYPPGYPAAILAAETLIGGPERAGQLASLVFGLLLLVVVYVFVRELFGRRAAAVALLIAVFQHQLSKYSVQVRAESMFFTLQLTALWLSLRAGRGGQLHCAVLAGLAAAGAFYARPEEGIVLAAFCVAWIAVETVRRKLPLGKKIAAPLSGAAVFAVCVAPFVVSVQGVRAVGRETEQPGLHVSLKRDVSADAVRENLDRPAKPEPAPDLSPSGAGKDEPVPAERGSLARFGTYLYRLMEQTGNFGISLHLFCSFFFVIGVLYRRAVPRQVSAEIALGIFAVVMLLIYPLVGSKHRHTVQLVAPLLVFAAAGVCEIARLAARQLEGDGARKRVTLVSGLVLVMLAVFYMAETIKPRRIEGIAVRRAGMLLSMKRPQARVLTPEAPVVFYADAEWLLDPARDGKNRRGVYTDFSERIDRGIEAGADYIVLEMKMLDTGQSNKDSDIPIEIRKAALEKLRSDRRLAPAVEFHAHPWFRNGDEVHIYRIIIEN